MADIKVHAGKNVTSLEEISSDLAENKAKEKKETEKCVARHLMVGQSRAEANRYCRASKNVSNIGLFKELSDYKGLADQDEPRSNDELVLPTALPGNSPYGFFENKGSQPGVAADIPTGAERKALREPVRKRAKRLEVKVIHIPSTRARFDRMDIFGRKYNELVKKENETIALCRNLKTEEGRAAVKKAVTEVIDMLKMFLKICEGGNCHYDERDTREGSRLLKALRSDLEDFERLRKDLGM